MSFNGFSVVITNLDVDADHRLSTMALFEALDRLVEDSDEGFNIEAGVLLLYTNHHFAAEYFPFGPPDGTVALGPWFDQELPVRGVYSHALDSELQLDKLFALDAMHDLRASPRTQGSSPAWNFLERLAGFARELWRDPTDSYSYFRRAPRPNELFFTYSFRDRERVRAYAEHSTAEGPDD